MQLIAAIAFRTIASNFKGGGGCETEREREGEGGREGGREGESESNSYVLHCCE